VLAIDGKGPYPMQPQALPADANLAALAASGDALLGEINRIREHDPVYWSNESQCWIISGHPQVLEGFGGALPLSSHALPEALYRILPKEELERRAPNTAHFMSKISTNLDGEEHAKLRKLLVKAVNRKLIEDLRPYVRERVSMLLDIAAAASELEFHEQIARMLPGAVILRLLGMSPDYLARLKGWSDAVMTALTSFDPQPAWIEALESVINDMLAVFRSEIEQRRSAAKPDLITQLLNTVEDGTRLTLDEMLATLIQVIIAGHDTTTSSMTLGVRALAHHPAAWAYWREHPDRSLDCTNELMRYMAMSTALRRVVTKDFQWQGRTLHAGDLVMLMIAGGNRDPLVFAHPEELDLKRPNLDLSLTFGPGLHHCIGHLLAKLQLSEFFGTLVRRFNGVEVLREPQFTPTLVFRGLTALYVRFARAPDKPCGA
jgi:cytochrome P450